MARYVGSNHPAWRRMTITRRVLLFLIASAVLLGALAVGMSLALEPSRMRDEVLARYAVLVNHSIDGMMVSMSDRTPKSIDDVLKYLAHDRVRSMRVITPSGTISHSSRPEEIGHQADVVMPQHFSGSTPQVTTRREPGDRASVTVLQPITKGYRCQTCHVSPLESGAIEVEFDATDLVQAATKKRELFGVVMFSTFLLAFSLLGVLLRKVLVQPAQKLVDGMRRVEQGNLDARIDVTGPREFAEMAQQFNTMVGKLDAAQRELQQFYARRMEAAERLATVGQLAATMAHEIRNPIAGLQGALEVLQRDQALADRRDILDEMLDTLRRLGNTANDLLTFAAPSSPTLDRTDLNAALRAVLGLLRQQARRAPVEIVEQLADDLPPVRCDARQMQQVFLNIALNAVQAMPDGGTLRVSSCPCPKRTDCVRIAFVDTGVGIAAADLGRVMEPFFTTKARGTGLGLAISRDIVTRHGGALAIGSEVGHGTTVTIELNSSGSPVDAIGAGRPDPVRVELERGAQA